DPDGARGARRERVHQGDSEWNLTEGTIKEIVLDHIEGTTLVDKFQAADTYFKGWEALTKEVNFDKDNRAGTLIAQFHARVIFPSKHASHITHPMVPYLCALLVYFERRRVRSKTVSLGE
ncbi:hypothetical protein HDU67_003901, partial [Dinochytrium kinnereticum]